MTAHRLEITHEARRSRARAGVLHTARGSVETPLVCVVGAGGSVGGLTPGELRELGARVLFASTYELSARPGPDVVRQLGGVHRLLAWGGPIVTDGGGAQVLERGSALAAGDRPGRPRGQPGRLLRVDDDGATFASPVDGSPQRLTPETAIAAQEALGGDITAALDMPVGDGHGERQAAGAAARTRAWARRCLKARTRADQALYGVVPATPFASLCRATAADIGSLPFEGAAIGGAVAAVRGVLEATIPALPAEWPRQSHGGEVAELLTAVDCGVDQVVCAAPVRLGQRGRVSSLAGALDVRDAGWRDDPAPIDERCVCYTCRAGFSRGYLRHLFVCQELLGYTLATLHNLHFLLQLMRDIRAAIAADQFADFRDELLRSSGSS